MPADQLKDAAGVPILLSGLIDALGTGLINVVSAPRGLDIPVAEALIYDQTGGLAAAADDLLLGVGIDPWGAAALDMLEAARQVGACAAVLKLADLGPPELIRAAQSAGVAVLGVPLATGWGQLLTLLRTARGARGVTGAGVELDVGDLFGLANSIATMVGGATTIEDLDSNVLAYSTLEHAIDKPRQDTILGRRVPSAWSSTLVDEGVFRRLYRSEGVVCVQGLTPTAEGVSGNGFDDPVELRPRLAITVRAGGEALGSIWVMEGAEPFTATADTALRAAAQIAAVHLLRHRAGANLERQRRAEFLRSLLDAGSSGAAVGALRLPHGAPLTVLAFAPDLSDDAELTLERLMGLITLHVEVFRRHAHTVCIDDIVYVLLSDPDIADTMRVRALADELRQRTELSAKTKVRVGIGSTVAQPRDLRRSREEADRVLGVLRHRDEPIGHVEDLRGAIALMRLEELMTDEPMLRAGKVDALVEHDARRHTNHVATLCAFLDCFGDVVAAASSLNIHRNTFRYRLARLIEVAELDLDDPEERLIAHLQLRLLGRRHDR